MKKGFVAVISGVLGIIMGAGGFYKLMGYEKLASKETKFRLYYQVLNQWMNLKNEGIGLNKYFMENDMKKIAIYGMGELGIRLTEELKDTSVTIEFGIDKAGGYSSEEFEVFSLEEELDEINEKMDGIDAIIVTAVFDYEGIEKKLSKQFPTKIISLKDVVFDSNWS